MSAWRMIDMRNQNALCTVGMLSALLENGSQDYTDLISPFILASTPENVGEKVELSEVQETVRKNYGFEDMPLDFIKGVLQRYANKDGYFRRDKYQFYVSTPFDRKDIITAQTRMREKIDYVLQKMQGYFEVHFVNEHRSLQEIKEMLEEFFECCGFEMAKDVENLQTVTANSYGKRVFWVARYVLSLVDGHTLELEYLLEMVKGFLICKALYYFENNNKTSLNSKLKNVTCYLDCSLVISSLGYNSEEREHEAVELIHLIRKSGGKVCVLEHTVEEAESLLDTFARLPGQINSFQLDGLAAKKFPSEILSVIASSVERNLEKKHQIKTVPDPRYSDVGNYIGIQDEEGIVEWLENSRKNKRRSRERYDYDAKSLSSIGMLRKGFHPEKIERCKAIMVTQDPFLSRCMKTLCPKRFPPEVDFTILDIDLVSLLWLENYNVKSSLPIDILIANATSLNLASSEIMDRAFELAEELAESGDIPEEAVLTIRSQPKIKKYLGEITQNDVGALTHTSVRTALNRYVNDATSELKKELDSTTTRLKSERDEATARFQKELSEKDEATAKLQKELEEARRENRKMKELRKQRLEAYVASITKKANRIAHAFECTLIGISSLILLLSIIAWGLKLFVDYVPLQGPAWTGLFIILDVLSLLQIWDYFRNPNGVVKKLSRKLHDWAFTHYYDRKIADLEKD